MSVQAMAWALDHRQTGALSPEARLVLVALADYADPQGRGAYPSAPTLAARLGVTVRAVRRSLAALEEVGVIAKGDGRLVEHFRADRRPMVYDLALEGRQTMLLDDGRVGVEPHRSDRHGVTTPTPRDTPDLHVDNPPRRDATDTPLPVDNSPRGDVGGRHGVTPASPKPSTKPNTSNPLPAKGDPQARARAREARRTVEDDPWTPVAPARGRSLGLTQTGCPNCGQPVLKTHHCRSSALDPNAGGHRANVRDFAERVLAGQAPPMRDATDDLVEHAPCACCGITAAHRPLIGDTGLCLRCIAAQGYQPVLDVEDAG